jgi:hypothetical protein
MFLSAVSTSGRPRSILITRWSVEPFAAGAAVPVEAPQNLQER